MEGIYLFPTVIFKVREFLNQDQCAEIVEHVRGSNELAEHSAMSGKAFSTHRSGSRISDIIESIPSCAGFKEKLLQQFNIAAKESGLYPLKLGNSWVNFQYKDSKLLAHRHPMSVMSAALYLKTDNQSSKIRFYNPNVHLKFWARFAENTQANFDHYEYNVSNGDLYIFPSWLEHSGDDKNLSEERVVFSCNSENA